MNDLIIFGAGGLGREVAWLVERINKKEKTWNLVGFIDDDETIQNTVVNGYKVLGKTESITEYPDAYYVCAVGAAKVRERIIHNLENIDPDIKFATLIDPSVEMSDLVDIGKGSIICAHTILTVNITVGKHVIVNPNCTVGHDAVISDFATLYPSVNISGTTKIGYCSEMGTGMQIIQGKTIGDYTIVGAGSVVVRDLPSRCTAVGTPAKPIKFHE